jgi:CDP-ribitol ribitolphosphotransferase / teichoic acid ribitol-phosphate polymerase
MKTILRITVFIINLVYQPFRLLPVQKKVTCISRQSDDIPADFLLIREDLHNHKDIKIQILAKKLTAQNPRVVLYPFHMLRQMYHIATSRAIVLDGYCIVASIVKHKPETSIIQIWHATAAIKKFGWQIVGKPSGSSLDTATIMRMHDKYDIVLAPSRRTAQCYQEAFRVGEDKIRYVGLPHLTQLVEPNFEMSPKMRHEFGLDPSKKTILYVPTFREGKLVNLQGLIDAIDFDKYELVAKIHPIDRLPGKDPRVTYPNRFSTTEWMHLADVIITDYSSLLVEAAILKKPLFLYVYDLEEYSGDTGLNIEYTEPFIAPIVYHQAADLVEALDKPYDGEVLEQLRQQLVEVDAAKCRKEFSKFILEFLK